MPTLPRETGWLLIVAYVLGLVMLMTTGLYDGPLAEPSLIIVLVCGVILASLFTRLVAPKPFVHDPARPPLVVAVVALTIFVIAAFADANLLAGAHGSLGLIHVLQAGQVVLLASYLPAILRGVREPRFFVELRFALFGVCLVVGTVSAVALAPSPRIDVWRAHTEAAQALLQGVNPYRSMQDSGLGFVYPPTSLYASALALLAHGDVRWAMVLSLLVAGIAMRFVARQGLKAPPLARLQGVSPIKPPIVRVMPNTDVTTAKASPGASARARAREGSAESDADMKGVSDTELAAPAEEEARDTEAPGAAPFPALAEDAPALMLWLTPKAYLFLEQSWGDALPLAFVALALWAHARQKRYLAAVLLGVALSSQQSMIWLLPLALLLAFNVGQWVTFLATAAVLIAPFAVWDIHSLKRSVFDLYGVLPGRADALTPTNWLFRHFGMPPREAPGVVLAAVTAAIAIWRAPRTRHAFALSVALAFFAFYLFNRWTFLNYYFFLTGLAALAAAVAVGERFERTTG
jgi:hypothetical protein